MNGGCERQVPVLQVGVLIKPVSEVPGVARLSGIGRHECERARYGPGKPIGAIGQHRTVENIVHRGRERPWGPSAGVAAGLHCRQIVISLRERDRSRSSSMNTRVSDRPHAKCRD